MKEEEVVRSRKSHCRFGETRQDQVPKVDGRLRGMMRGERIGGCVVVGGRKEGKGRAVSLWQGWARLGLPAGVELGSGSEAVAGGSRVGNSGRNDESPSLPNFFFLIKK